MANSSSYGNAIHKDTARAFTLIEVLVVVAIIALLISILLPSLKRAREQARAAVCAANNQQIARGEGTYQTTNREWIPGSPLTTGWWWAKTNANSWIPTVFRPGAGFSTRFAVEWFDFATPLRAAIYGSKVIPPVPTAAEAKPVQMKLWSEATTGLFHCPSNPYVATPYGNGSGGFPTIQSVSYLSSLGLNRGGPGVYADAGPGKTYAASNNDIAQASSWEVVPPTNYMPRHSRVGRESMKVFVADGFRFFDPAGLLTYNVEPASTKGTMAGTPPSASGTADPTHAREYRMAKEYSWRHGDRNAIVAVFFDGHAETLKCDNRASNPSAYWTGDALHPKYYYPSNSVVKIPSTLHLNNIPVNTVLP